MKTKLIKEIWHSEDEGDWKVHLELYYKRLEKKPELPEIENEILKYDENTLQKMKPKE